MAGTEPGSDPVAAAQVISGFPDLDSTYWKVVERDG